MTREVGFHAEVPMSEYVTWDALGSSRLEWLAISPKHYKYMLEQPAEEETDAQFLGTAVHMAALQPELFLKTYTPEPDVNVVAPGSARPRATNAYKDAVAELERDGLRVVRTELMVKVLKMAEAVRIHPAASKVLDRAPEREVSALWSRGERLCRGRFDLLGPGVMADLKTTRSLKTFSPWAITKYGYYRQAGWYCDGLKRLGRDVQHVFLIAVENVAPFDVGVFALNKETVSVGLVEADALAGRLLRCEMSGEWPGMFPDVQEAMLTDALALDLASGEEV